MKTNVQYKKIKAGNVAKFIKSKRQRDDIPCSLEGCYICESPAPILNQNRALLLLDYNIVADQIDAIENFEIINNCIIPLSEYLLINQKNQQLFKRFNQVVEQRNIYIFPNEFHSEIILMDENTIKRENRQNVLFAKTAEYLFKHFMIVSKDIRLIVLTNSKTKENYLKAELMSCIEKEDYKDNLSKYRIKPI
jgi:hypothetical protein